MARPKTRAPGDTLVALYVEKPIKREVVKLASEQGRQIKQVTEDALRTYLASRTPKTPPSSNT